MPDQNVDKIAQLHDAVETLAQGLRMMVETQATHTEMLQAIMEAATEKVGESPLPGLLTQIVERLDEQTGILHQMEAAASGILMPKHQVGDGLTPSGVAKVRTK